MRITRPFIPFPQLEIGGWIRRDPIAYQVLTAIWYDSEWCQTPTGGSVWLYAHTMTFLLESVNFRMMRDDITMKQIRGAVERLIKNQHLGKYQGTIGELLGSDEGRISSKYGRLSTVLILLEIKENQETQGIDLSKQGALQGQAQGNSGESEGQQCIDIRVRLKNQESLATVPALPAESGGGLLSNPVVQDSLTTQPEVKWVYELTVIAAFEAVFPWTPKLRKPWATTIGLKALKSIATRAKTAGWRAGDISAWVDLFERLGEAHSVISKMAAEGKASWFNLPWLLLPTNFEKTVAGNYDGQAPVLEPEYVPAFLRED